uniref:Uncharacterized protein n=1 Tax=Anguilla anguilla TaxID=7936 RepID=A0A0E9VTJ4_ANGAN
MCFKKKFTRSTREISSVYLRLKYVVCF